MHLNTPYATLSFPRLFAPRERALGDGNPVYSCSLLFQPAEQKSQEFKAMQEAVIQAAKEEFGPTVSIKSLVLPFRDAGEKDYKGYDDGVVYISPWSKQRPGIVDARLQDVLDADSVYAGQIVCANLTPFAWANTGRKGVSFGLNHIQIVKKNAPRIDGRIAANKAFNAVVDEDTDTDMPF